MACLQDGVGLKAKLLIGMQLMILGLYHPLPRANSGPKRRSLHGGGSGAFSSEGSSPMGPAGDSAADATLPAVLDALDAGLLLLPGPSFVATAGAQSAGSLPSSQSAASIDESSQPPQLAQVGQFHMPAGAPCSVHRGQDCNAAAMIMQTAY